MSVETRSDCKVTLIRILMSTESPYNSRGGTPSRTSLAAKGGDRQCLNINRSMLF